jgi:6-phosphogluconolactonase (cycloisomerase 2 family)
MSKEKRELHPESSEVVDRRAFMQVAAGVVAGAAAAGGIPEIAAAQTSPVQARGGHLYMQTNETQNCIIHYHWSANGTLTEVERVATRGAGSGVLSPIYHISRPNHFEGAGSVILTPDRRFLFATNGGNNSVSSFAVGKEGRLTLLDVKWTGNTKSGGAKSVAYAPSSSTLFVVHTFGPDNVRLMSVDDEGTLTARPEKYSVGTMEWPNRVPTMAVL